MKKLIIVILCFCATASYAQLQMYGRYAINGNGKIEPDINLFGTKKLSEKVKLTYFALIEEKWSEALIGISYSPAEWMSLGLSSGVEHNPAIYRFGGSIWLGRQKTSLLMLGEKGDGKGNYWYKTVLSYEFTDQFTFGAVAWRFHGVGPIVQYSPKKSDLAIWYMPAYDPEFKTKKMMLGLSIKI